MSSIIASVVSALFPIALKIVDLWMQQNKKNREMTESYYSFLNHLDSSGVAKAKQYLNSEDALKAKQEELSKELTKEKK